MNWSIAKLQTQAKFEAIRMLNAIVIQATSIFRRQQLQFSSSFELSVNYLTLAKSTSVLQFAQSELLSDFRVYGYD